MRRLSCVLLTLGLLTGPLRAQTVAERAEIARWRDSLRRVENTASIASLVTTERAKEYPRASRDLGRIRLGWVLMQQGQVTGAPAPFTAAMTEFYEAGIRHRSWPEPWFGLGAAKIALDGIGVREIRSAHQTAGNGWRQGAILAFMDALRADPDFRDAAIEAAKLTLRDDNVAVRTALPQAIERAVALDSSDALGWMLLGRMRRRLGNDRGASDAYGVAVRLGGEVRGVASLELARQLAALGDEDSASSVYYSGASAPDSQTAAAYHADLKSIATVADLAEWDSLPATSRPAWLHDFWHHREVVSGRPAGTRLPEHFRRWRSAYRQYRLPPAWTRQYEFGMPYRSGNDELDDRGVIFVRHGEPDIRLIHFASECEESAESWIYERDEGRMIFHFKSGGVPGWCKKHSAPTSGWRAVESITYVSNHNILPNLADVDPLYMSMYLGSLGGSRAGGISLRWGSEVEMLRESLDRGTTTDSDPLRFDHPLHPVVQAYGVGGDLRGEGRILVVWSIPAEDRLGGDTVPGIEGLLYALRTRINATDSSGKVLVEVDSIHRFRTRTGLKPGQSLSGIVVLDAPAGPARVRLAIADSGETRGAFRMVEGVPVPAFEGDFELSDLVLGIEGSGLYWVSGDRRFPLNPRNAWTPAEAMEVGFEMEGLPAGTTYKVKIAVADLGADSTKPPRASVEFENQASGTRELVTQSLGLRTLRPGRYLLTVTVTAGDRSIRRERRITIAQGR